MDKDLIRVVFEEFRTVIEELEYWVADHTSDLVHPRHKFAHQQNLQTMLNSKRRLMVLRESFLGRLLGEICSDKSEVEELKKVIEGLQGECQSREDAIECCKHSETLGETRLSTSIDKLCPKTAFWAQKILDTIKKGGNLQEVLTEALEGLRDGDDSDT